MGYQTDFTGAFDVTPPLSPEHKAYLEAFASTRHMKRKVAVVENLPDPLRIAVGLPVGEDGCYYIGTTGHRGNQDSSVLDFEASTGRQPSLWCQWIPSEDGTKIQWNGVEKFYAYAAWIRYLIENFLKPWGYTLSGEVDWFGDRPNDFGTIRAANNLVGVRS